MIDPPMRALVMAVAIAVLGPPPPPKSSPPPGDPGKPPPSSPSTPSKPSGPTSSTPPPPPGVIPPSGEPTAEPKAEQPPVDLSDTWTYNRGGGSRPRYIRSGELVEIAPNPDGYYSGVSIEGNHVPPHPAKSLGSKPALLTWTGFERTSGGSRVFFELSADVDTKLDIKGSTITLRLANTKLNRRNNGRFLDLRWFRTPVASVKVGRKGKDAIATIQLKREATPTLVVMEGKEGYRLLVVEFAGAAEPAE
jgi:hypothetical protein